MSDATITFTDPEQILALFGPRDQYLRRVRNTLGVNVVLRGDQLLVQGPEDQVRQGVAVLNQLRKTLELQGGLSDADITEALTRQVHADPGDEQAAIPLFEKSRKIVPRSPGQMAYIQSIRENDLVFCTGPAGCGKTYLAVAMAVHALRQEQIKKIVLVRPAVEAGEKIGFLPGDMLAKVNPFLRPLLDSLIDILDSEQVGRYLEKDVIEIIPLAYMRGRTLNQTFIILDEAQNTTITQMKMFLTRMGNGSKIVASGDVTQVDLPPHIPNGLSDAIDRLSSIHGIAAVKLSGRDIVRHPLVREIVKAYEPLEHASRSGHRLT
ncbi:MAG: PhoH family protein [Planctomycetales bacterium]